jgi:hypothetical protein
MVPGALGGVWLFCLWSVSAAGAFWRALSGFSRPVQQRAFAFGADGEKTSRTVAPNVAAVAARPWDSASAPAILIHDALFSRF